MKILVKVKCYLMTNLDFVNWLEKQLQVRGWKPSDLAHAAKISTGTLSNILNRTRRAGPATCLAIAQALAVPPEQVFRRADLLPAESAVDERKRELIYLYDQLDAETQAILRVIARALVELPDELKKLDRSNL